MTSTSQDSETEVFWGELSPSEHIVQIYGDEHGFLDSLTGFVAGGLERGEAVIIIATEPHRIALDARLRALDIDVDAARATDQYIVLDADETLSRFMAGSWPNEERFKFTVNGILKRARARGRRVRAFGEMVAILWARGQNGATVRLERIWGDFCQTELLRLFCAYPKSGFTENADVSIRQICDCHTRVLAG